MIHRLSLDTDHAAWERAIERAKANGYQRRAHFDAATQGNGFKMIFLVESASTLNKRYDVQLTVQDGQREASCDCVATRHCWHMAAAALTAGMLTDDDRKSRIAAAALDVSAIISGEYAVAQ